MPYNLDCNGIVWFSVFDYFKLDILLVRCNSNRCPSNMFYNNGKRKRIMILSDEDIKFIKFSFDCISNGRYPHTEQLTETYNRCFADRPNFRPIQNTNCGSCIKHRICELYYEMKGVLGDIS